MANKDLFKQAIAEAKSIREAAIANAKEALEETLTPHLKDMLAAKLQEMEDNTNEEEVISEAPDVEEAHHNDEGKEPMEEEEKHEGKDHIEEEETHEGEEPMEEAEDAHEAKDDSEESDDEAEEDEAGDDDQEVKDMDVEDLKDLIRDIVAQEIGDHGGEDAEDHSDMDAGDDMAGEDETIDLDELLAELDELAEEDTHEGEEPMEEAHTDEGEEPMEEVVAEEEDKHEGKDHMEEELNEALSTVESLRKELNEVNLLNAKLLFVNKIFKSNELSESQKVNVIAAFDKAETVKEVKLVYETVSENVVTKKQSTIKESKLGMASKATGTTAAKPEIISEVSDSIRRMQKLAGIIK